MIGAIILATVLRFWKPEPVTVPVRAGLMTWDTEVVCIEAEAFMEPGEMAHISTGAQFVSDMWNITIGIGKYLVCNTPDGEEVILVHPHTENHDGIMQHYLHCNMTSYYQADQGGTHRFEYRVYSGTGNLKKDSTSTSVYNEMTIAIH